jgi:DNA-binding winged helix-turn-helix (wHTH) protein
MADNDRKRLLRRTDNILDGIERLRLRESDRVPERLRTELADVVAELGLAEPRRSMSLAATHDYLFRLQGLLLRNGKPMQPTQRISSPPRYDPVPALALPPRISSDDAGWREGARLTVQRSHDIARYFRAQARAARQLADPEAATLAKERSDQAGRAEQQYEHLADLAKRALNDAALLDPPPVLPSAGRLEFRDIVIEIDSGWVRQADQVVRLSPVERTILTALVANHGRVISREAMLHLLYGDNPAVNVRSKVFDVSLGHVRRKLGDPPYLQTLRGMGFRASESATDRLSRTPGVENARQRRREQRRAWAQGGSTPAGDRQSPERDPGRSRTGWKANKRY